MLMRNHHYPQLRHVAMQLIITQLDIIHVETGFVLELLLLVTLIMRLLVLQLIQINHGLDIGRHHLVQVIPPY